MNEELWASVERKMIAYEAAKKAIGVACETCGEWLDPQDTGVNPYTGIRYWVTNCCGNVHRYEEKVNMGFRELVEDDRF